MWYYKIANKFACVPDQNQISDKLEVYSETCCFLQYYYFWHKHTRAVLSQGGSRDAAVNFDKKNLQRHRAVSVSQHGFPV